MLHTIDRFSGQDGVTLFEQTWLPEKPARAAVVLIHGLVEHSGRHAATAAALVDEGFAVHAMDLRGHGQSAGPRGDVPSFDRYLLDLDVFFARVRAREEGRESEPVGERDRPLFLMGNSMGGLIVSLWTVLRRPRIAGLILTGPLLALADGLYPRLRYLVRVTRAVAPALRVPPIPFRSLSRDANAVASFRNDPLILQHSFTVRVAAEVLRAIDQMSRRAESLGDPLLILHGGEDRICGPAGSEALYRKAASADKTFHLYEGLYHELLDEPERLRVLSDLKDWLDRHAPHNVIPPSSISGNSIPMSNAVACSKHAAT